MGVLGLLLGVLGFEGLGLSLWILGACGARELACRFQIPVSVQSPVRFRNTDHLRRASGATGVFGFRV